MPINIKKSSSRTIFSFLETKTKKIQAWGWVQIGMGNSQIRFTETLQGFYTFKMFYNNMKKIQHFKTIFYRSLLLSNMQICYPRRK